MKKEQPAPQVLLQLQRRIFRSLELETDRLLGETPSEIFNYEKVYRTDFKKISRRFELSNKEALVKEIRKSDVTFIGDFHSFQQAQRTALRLFREAILPGENWAIGLEMIPSSYQKVLDDFQAGKIAVKTFHELIHYQEQWGFPWENYAPIFEWAHRHRVRLIALNRPKEFLPGSTMLRRVGRKGELHDRDQWAAGLITDYFHEQKGKKPKPKMIVIYGELHLARNHLPRQMEKISSSFLGKKLKWLTIHQNNTELYWKLAKKGLENEANVLRLKKNSYCVFSGTPWNKLQSLISWLEGESNPGFDFTDPESEFLSAMRTYGNAITELFELRSVSFENLTIKTVTDTDFMASMAESRNRRIFKSLVTANQRVYVEASEVGASNFVYLPTFSENWAAELAAVHIFKSLKKSSGFSVKTREDWFRLVSEYAFGFLGSLVMNPRRKCDLRSDHLIRIKALRESHDHELDSRRLAAAMSAKNRSRGLGMLTEYLDNPKRSPALVMSARYLGQIIGKKLHEKLLDEEITPLEIQRILLSRAKDHEKKLIPVFEEFFETALKRELASSKTDVL